MNDNGTSQPQDTATGRLGYLTWRTLDPISLPTGSFRARGDASPMVRSQSRASELGDLDAQVAHVQDVIVEALASVLHGMGPSAEQLPTLGAEIASATLVLANTKLAARGISLLDLTLTELSVQG